MGGNQVKVKEIELQKEIEIEKMRIRSGEEERERDRKHEIEKMNLENERLEETNRHKEAMLEKSGKIVKDIWKEHIDAQVKEGFTNEIAVKNTERVLVMVCEQLNIEGIEEEDLKKE